MHLQVISHKEILFLIVVTSLLLFPISSMAYGPEVYSELNLVGGQVLDIEIDPFDTSKIFAACANGDGLFLSRDGGDSWTPVLAGGQVEGEDTFKNQLVSDVEISPTNPDIVWGVHNQWAEKSTDGGRTWEHIRNDTMQAACVNCSPDDGFRICYSVAIDPLNPDIVYVGTGGPEGSDANGAIYKTSDGGDTWEKLFNIRDIDGNDLADFHQPVYDIEIDINSNSIWAMTNSPGSFSGALYLSSDSGSSWIVRVSANALFADVEVKPHSSSQNSEVFIATAYGIRKLTYGVYQDGSPLELLDARWVVEGWNYVREIDFSSNNPDKLYAVWHSPTAWGGDGIGKIGQSVDSGETWAVTETNKLFFSLAVDPGDDSILYAGHEDSGVFISPDSGNGWTAINNGLSAVIIRDIAIDANDSQRLLAATNVGLFERALDGEWRRLHERSTASVAIDPSSGTTLYTGIEGYFAKSVDGGGSWTYTNIPDNVSYNYISDIAIDPLKTDSIYIAVDYFGFGGAVHRSTDGGLTFEKVLDSVNQNGEAIPMNAVAVDPNNSQRVFAGSGSFFTPRITGELWVSEDGGANWQRTRLNDVIVNAISINPDDSTIMYVGCGYSGGTQIPLYKSVDGGGSWSGAFEGISGQPWNAVTDLGFSSDGRNVLYASTLFKGVYLSPDEGGNWLNLGTPAAHVHAIGISSLYAGTENGLFQLTGTGVLAGEIYNDHDLALINNARVTTDLGLACQAIDGRYMMVAPAGNFDVYATADQHGMSMARNVTLAGGEVTWQDFAMSSDTAGDGSPGGSLTIDNDHSGGGAYCFIGAGRAADSPPVPWSLVLPVLVLALLLTCNRRRWHGWLLLLLLSLAGLLGHPGPSAAFSIFQQVGVTSPPMPVGSGARALGMGGTFIAIADDATAASWNPAGLVQLERPEISIVGDYFSRSESFSSDQHPEISNTCHSEELNVNYLSAAFPVHWHKNMVFSLNYQRLYDFYRDLGYTRNLADGDLQLSQQIQFDQRGSVGAVGLAGGVELTPRLSVGLTVNLWTDQLGYANGWDATYKESSTGTQSGIPVTFNTSIQDRYEQFRGINFNLGLLWDLEKWGALGVVAKTPFRATIQHHYRFDQTQAYGDPLNTSTTNGPITVDEEVALHLPWSYGLGWSKRFTDRLTLGVDLYRTEWSGYYLTDGQGNEFSPIDGRPRSDSDIDATTHLRIGGEYLLLRPVYQVAVPIRAGLFYDPEPTEGHPQDVFGMALGSGITISRFSIDLAYQLRLAANLDSGNIISGSSADKTQQTVLASMIYYF